MKVTLMVPTSPNRLPWHQGLRKDWHIAQVVERHKAMHHMKLKASDREFSGGCTGGRPVHAAKLPLDEKRSTEWWNQRLRTTPGEALRDKANSEGGNESRSGGLESTGGLGVAGVRLAILLLRKMGLDEPDIGRESLPDTRSCKESL